MMFWKRRSWFLSLVVAGVALMSIAADKASSVLNHTVKDIDGKAVALSQYEGDVLLIVNTASKCGLTPQYEGLEAAYQKYKGQGFKVLAFPANQFAGQEPGTDSQIKSFCTGEYHSTFPLFAKIVVKGKGIDPLYQFLTSKETDPKFAGDIAWNFSKFLINRKGEVIARFEPKQAPDSPEMVAAIEAAIAESK